MPVRALLTLLLLSVAVGMSAGLPRGLGNAVPSRGEIIEPFEADSISRLLASRPLHAIEGIWQWADIDTRVAIMRTGDDRSALPATIYAIIVVYASDPAIRPGSVMGYLATTATRDQYDARIYTSVSESDGHFSRPAKYTLHLNDAESRISFRPYGEKIRFNWWRLLPYRLRGLFTRENRSPGEMEGLLRLYPSPQRPHHPVYL